MRRVLKCAFAYDLSLTVLNSLKCFRFRTVIGHLFSDMTVMGLTVWLTGH